MNFREQWRELRRGRPGKRFQDGYELLHRAKGGLGPLQRLILLFGGLVSLVIAIVLTLFPGPAIPFYFVAGALFAVQSRALARLMDWLEVRARRTARWMWELWRRIPGAVQWLLLVLGACTSATLAYVMYRLLR